ncbi:homoserine dehydrogenase [Lysobacter sp. TY2-98]|uniref:homoserine dehydrogenase n=1 Tax=Lysobacter sp. TY2-98 TaxID=2290922 RepID=UPI000E20146C|nr:homoserine dehydrogenase [Lysobacter sp. TY2-98]AXK71364.1 homoserine dehydrogenase [Lysobacter sp. TY2-98]
MEALARAIATAPRKRAAVAAEIALLGVGTVGSALLQRLDRLHGAIPPLRLVHVANSRRSITTGDGIAPAEAHDRLATASSSRDATLDAFDGSAPAIVIDASGSEAVAARHADWLAQGVHVVTASKLGQGVSLARWQAIQSARRAARTQYGDAATVGAGLPLLRSLRALHDGGDAITGIAGVLSGSMAWLFGAYDGLRPFSGFVRQAREAGYTEPDPREDLSGEDVRRKLLILARAAGFPLDADDVHVDSLVPASLARCAVGDVDAALDVLDGPLRERFAQAYKHGEKLRHVARLDIVDGRVTARVGVESLSPGDALAAGQGTDNRVAIRCDRYDAQPLVIQGPGAGAGVTAAALLDDVLRIARSTAL